MRWEDRILTQRRKGAKAQKDEEKIFLSSVPFCVFAPLRLCVENPISSQI
jgi:hypothetical protein